MKHVLLEKTLIVSKLIAVAKNQKTKDCKFK